MFKPSLKRSKLSQSSSWPSQIPNATQIIKQKDKTYIKQKINNPNICIPQFFTKAMPNERNDLPQKIITPLNCWNLQYPHQVKEKLAKPIQHIKSRIVGTQYGVFWLLTQNELYLWRYDSNQTPSTIKIHRKYEFEKSIRAVSIGHLDMQACSLFIPNLDNETIAIGFENMIQLYSIDLLTLQLRPIEIRIKVQFRQTLQKMEFTEYNELLFTGDQGFLTRVAFDSFSLLGYNNISKSNARPSKFTQRSLLTALQLSKSKSKVYTERILRTNNDKIYVLVRKQNEKSILSRLSHSVLKMISGRIKQDEQLHSIQKQIQVYKITDKKYNKIKYEGTITNEEIQKKINQSYLANQMFSKLLSENHNNHSHRSNTIANIFINKYKKQQESSQAEELSVVTNYGLFLILRQNLQNTSSNLFNFSFIQQPRMLPSQLLHPNSKKLSTALFLKGKKYNGFNNEGVPIATAQQFEPFLQKNSKIIYSLGLNNISLLSNGLCVHLQQKEIQIAKFENHPGYIMQACNQVDQTITNKFRTWYIFSKSQITIIRKSQVSENLLTFISALSELQKQSKSMGEKTDEYQRYANMMMDYVSQVIGSQQVCRGLCSLLLQIIRNKIGQLPKVSSQGESILYINNEAKEVAKEQLRIKIAYIKKLKSMQAGRQQGYGVFARWLIPKRKQIHLEQISITAELEQTVWKLFTIYSLQKMYQFGREQPNQSIIQSMNIPNFSVLSVMLSNLFRQQYAVVKNMGITELRRSPRKIKAVKINLITILNFLQNKKNKSVSLLQKIMYFKSQISEGSQKPVSEVLNTTLDSLNSSHNQGTEMDRRDSLWANSSLPNVMYTYRQIEHSIEEIENQLYKLVSKLLNVVQLYELLAANSQHQYEGLPSIDKFMSLLSAKKEVKAALLDLLSSTEIWKDPTILKYSELLPQLMLQSDIYLSKWIKFIEKAQAITKQFDSKSSVDAQIQVSDLQELSKHLELEQILKIKYLFKAISPLYVRVLATQLQFRKMQHEAIKEIIKLKEVSKDFILDRSLFESDRLKSNVEWKEWLYSQIVGLRGEVNNYLRELTHAINISPPQQYLKNEQLLDDSIKQLEKSEERDQFIKQLVNYLRQTKTLPEKAYRLSLSGNSKSRASLNLAEDAFKPEFMSSLNLINSLMKRTKQQIFTISPTPQVPSSNKSRDEAKEIKSSSTAKNGQTTTIL